MGLLEKADQAITSANKWMDQQNRKQWERLTDSWTPRRHSSSRPPGPLSSDEVESFLEAAESRSVPANKWSRVVLSLRNSLAIGRTRRSTGGGNS